MTSRALRLLLVGALFCGMGGHWAVLQGFAWARMASKGEKVDGRHPCTMCLKIKRSAGAEVSLSASLRSSRAALVALGPAAVGSVSAPARFLPTAPFSVRIRAFSPETPPPRSLPA